MACGGWLALKLSDASHWQHQSAGKFNQSMPVQGGFGCDLEGVNRFPAALDNE